MRARWAPPRYKCAISSDPMLGNPSGLRAWGYSECVVVATRGRGLVRVKENKESNTALEKAMSTNL